MHNRIVLMALLFMSILTSTVLTSCDKEKTLESADIPQEIEDYVAEHFPEFSILQVIKDRDGLTKEYQVILKDNIRLEFNGDFVIQEIKWNSKLPDSVIPIKIRKYATENFSDNVIIIWEIDGKNQQVTLDNGIDLEFTMDGEFIKIDN